MASPNTWNASSDGINTPLTFGLNSRYLAEPDQNHDLSSKVCLCRTRLLRTDRLVWEEWS